MKNEKKKREWKTSIQDYSSTLKQFEFWQNITFWWPRLIIPSNVYLSLGTLKLSPPMTIHTAYSHRNLYPFTRLQSGTTASFENHQRRLRVLLESVEIFEEIRIFDQKNREFEDAPFIANDPPTTPHLNLKATRYLEEGFEDRKYHWRKMLFIVSFHWKDSIWGGLLHHETGCGYPQEHVFQAKLHDTRLSAYWFGVILLERTYNSEGISDMKRGGFSLEDCRQRSAGLRYSTVIFI